MLGWWIWHGAWYAPAQNTWVWSRSNEPMEFANWITTANASSMPGVGNWVSDDPYNVGAEGCTFLNPTHYAGLINDVCGQAKRVLCEYD